MSVRLKKSRIIVPHSNECWAKGRNQWSGMVVESFFGNYAANRNTKKGTHHYWHSVACNNPKCPGIKAVHSSVLRDA